jgi:hypothetical protein
MQLESVHDNNLNIKEKFNTFVLDTISFQTPTTSILQCLTPDAWRLTPDGDGRKTQDMDDHSSSLCGGCLWISGMMTDEIEEEEWIGHCNMLCCAVMPWCRNSIQVEGDGMESGVVLTVSPETLRRYTVLANNSSKRRATSWPAGPTVDRCQNATT